MEIGKGDYTRFTYDRSKHYAHVLSQQGRVTLDADQIEEAAILDHLEHVRTADLVGRSGVPADTPDAFRIVVDKQDFTIRAGRIYVDGILCELEKLDDGRDPTYLNQEDYPNPDPKELDPKPGRTDLVYLDVWQRHITAVEDPDIREVALGGPDTSTRLKTMCQVKVLLDVGDVKCDLDPKSIKGWPTPSGARMSTTTVETQEPKPCIIPERGGYTGLENHLYRVEIHAIDSQGHPRFKWSKDNGSVVLAVDSFPADKKIKLKELGRDDVLSLHPGDWVEVLDDVAENSTGVGTMAQVVTAPDKSDLVLTLDRSIPAYDPTENARVRRWDQKQNVGADGLVDAAGSVVLENGVQVTFSGSDFKPTNYWAFAARTTSSTGTPDVERLVNSQPHGTRHRYCKLALIKWPAQILPTPSPIAAAAPTPRRVRRAGARARATTPPVTAVRPEIPTPQPIASVHDCRPKFQPLAEPTWPTVADIGWSNDSSLSLQRFNEGLTVTFSEDMNFNTASLDTFVVTLELAEQLNFPFEQPQPRPVEPTVTIATAALATQPVGAIPQPVEPSHVAGASQPSHPPPSVPTSVATRVVTETPSVISSVQPPRPVVPAVQPTSVMVGAPQPVTPTAPTTQPVPSVVHPVQPAQPPVTLVPPPQPPTLPPAIVLKTFAGRRPFIVQGEVSQLDLKTWRFKPSPSLDVQVLTHWLDLESKFFPAAAPMKPRVRCRVRLKGNAILDALDMYPLDGDVFTRISKDPTGALFSELILPSGDGNKGGDFESWFYLIPEVATPTPTPIPIPIPTAPPVGVVVPVRPP